MGLYAEIADLNIIGLNRGIVSVGEKWLMNKWRMGSIKTGLDNATKIRIP
jgi:hypothetical protein